MKAEEGMGRLLSLYPVFYNPDHQKRWMFVSKKENEKQRLPPIGEEIEERAHNRWSPHTEKTSSRACRETGKATVRELEKYLLQWLLRRLYKMMVLNRWNSLLHIYKTILLYYGWGLPFSSKFQVAGIKTDSHNEKSHNAWAGSRW